MDIKLTKTVLVGGYGHTAVAAGTVVTPATVDEAKALISRGYAKEDTSGTAVPPPSQAKVSPVSGVLSAEEVTAIEDTPADEEVAPTTKTGKKGKGN